jgi:GDPmannose 4,6-dehydratase
MTEAGSLDRLLHAVKPHEVYNLGAQSHVGVSFLNPVYTSNANALGTLRILESVRGLDYPVRFYQASSSEMFGSSTPPQDETTPFHPRSPYGVSKVYAYWQTVNHREAFDMWAANGILFNHESPRRGETFVTRKITRGATRIKLGLQDKLFLGNLDAERDWGFAGDYAEAMWLMLQADQPDDFVIATGERRSVSEFCELAFSRLDLDWEQYVEIDPIYLRPSEVDALQGDATKAREELGWKPRVSVEELAAMMVDADLVLAQRERTLADAGLMGDTAEDHLRYGAPES